jgi:hypothetical protein
MQQGKRDSGSKVQRIELATLSPDFDAVGLTRVKFTPNFKMSRIGSFVTLNSPET